MLGEALIMLGDSDSLSSKFSALLAPLCTSPIWFLLRGFPGRALAAWAFATSLVLSVQACWSMRKHLWFWVMVAVLTALHVLLVLYIPWPNVYTTIGGPAFVPFGLLDFGIFLGCMKLVEKLMSKSPETGAAA